MSRLTRQVPMGITKDGFRSLLERSVAQHLTTQGIDFLYEQESIPYTVEHKYTPDFKLPNGIYIEVKGWFTPEDRGKLLEVKRQWPKLDIRLVFGNAKNRLSKSSKTTYAAWCEKHGFLWADKRVPTQWMGSPAPKTPTEPTRS